MIHQAKAVSFIRVADRVKAIVIESPPTKERAAQVMSNGELKRHMQQGGVLVNGERILPDEPIDFPVFSLVFFPKSAQRRTTIV